MMILSSSSSEAKGIVIFPLPFAEQLICTFAANLSAIRFLLNPYSLMIRLDIWDLNHRLHFHEFVHITGVPVTILSCDKGGNTEFNIVIPSAYRCMV